jgi:hypothetical protein
LRLQVLRLDVAESPIYLVLQFIRTNPLTVLAPVAHVPATDIVRVAVPVLAGDAGYEFDPASAEYVPRLFPESVIRSWCPFPP